MCLAPVRRRRQNPLPSDVAADVRHPGAHPHAQTGVGWMAAQADPSSLKADPVSTTLSSTNFDT